MLLRHHTSWAVVDVRGSVFEYANCSESETDANLHVSESGIVQVSTHVMPGEELVWWYGTLFGLAVDGR